ncbi:MAG: peptide deformylase [Succinivibrionaceae bacterium]|jgi:peptide deformylase|nr:peptide deformylase [Succinivibrionaceae bacterium]
MIKDIVKDQSFLARISEPATREDLPVAQDLIDTLKAHEGSCVGLAANMIGISRQIIIVKVGLSSLVMFNPKITMQQSPYKTEEGCLSLEGMRETTRFLIIEVEYLDQKWQKKKKRFRGFTAQIIQHEVDHLNGVII